MEEASLMGFLDDYEPVEDRLEKFWADHPNGRIITEIVAWDSSSYIVKATVWREDTEDNPAATGLAQETVTATGVNKTSALENCETSAIGRALANLGYAAKGKRASREEMEKATREDPDEDEAIAAWRRLWEDAKVLKSWDDEERMVAIKAAMKLLKIEEVTDRDKAETILAHITDEYGKRPMDEQGALPVAD